MNHALPRPRPALSRRGPRAWLPLLLVAVLVAVSVLDGSGAWRPQRASAAPDSEECGLMIQVDQPGGGTTVRGPVTITGWAVDPAATADTGVVAVQVYLDGPRDRGRLLGDARYGLERSDLGESLGANFTAGAFDLRWDPAGLTGPHVLYIYAQSVCGWQGVEVPVLVEPVACAPQLVVEFPAEGSKVPSPGEFVIYGWAADPKSPNGTGVTNLRTTQGADGAGAHLGVTRTGLGRMDVAATLGVSSTRFLNTGWATYLDGRQMTTNAGGETRWGPTTVTIVGDTRCGPVTKTINLEMVLPAANEMLPASAIQPPRNLRLNQYNNGLAVISWDPSPSQKVTGYVIQAAKGSNSMTNKKTVTPAELTAEVGGLDRSETWSFQVYALQNELRSPTTNVVTSTDRPIPIGALPLPPVTPGDRPANDLTPTPKPGATQVPVIAANGQPVSGGAPNFLGLPGNPSGVYTVPTDDTSGAPPADPGQAPPPPTATPASIFPPTGGATSTPAASVPTPTPATNVPPTIILNGTAASRQVTLTFNAVPGAQSYQLMRSSTANGTYAQVATAPAGANTIIDPGVPSTGTFYYQVVVVGAGNAKSQPSNTFPVTVR